MSSPARRTAVPLAPPRPEKTTVILGHTGKAQDAATHAENPVGTLNAR